MSSTFTKIIRIRNFSIKIHKIDFIVFILYFHREIPLFHSFFITSYLTKVPLLTLEQTLTSRLSITITV